MNQRPAIDASDETTAEPNLTPRQYALRVAEAAEVVAQQAGCTIDAAALLMHERATADHCSLEDLALAIISGAARFTPG